MSEAIQRGASHPLGATPVLGGVNFSVYSEDATALELLLFDRVDDPTPARVIALDPGQHRTYHYWHDFVPDLGAGQLYAWRAHGPAEPSPRLRFDPSKVLLDPYGRGVAVSTGYDRTAAAAPGGDAGVAMKSVVVDPSTYDWEGDEPLRRPFSQTVIYEMHVAGFTRHPSSGDPLQAASTQMEGRIGLTLASFHFPMEDDLPTNASYLDPRADSASLGVPKRLKLRADKTLHLLFTLRP